MNKRQPAQVPTPEEAPKGENLNPPESTPVENPAAQVPTPEEAPKGEPKDQGLSVATASAQVISSSKTDVDVHAGLVKVRIQYPEDYKGQKFFKEGDIKPVSKELAEQFVKQGIAVHI